MCVYKNGENVFLSTEHNYENENEIERLKIEYPGVWACDTQNIKIMSTTKLCGTISKYVNLKNGLVLATTQAIGHFGRTGYLPDYKEISYSEGDDLQIIIASDGFWDMTLKDDVDEMAGLCKLSCAELLSRASNRWLQEWEMYLNETTTEFQKGRFTRRMADDVAVVTISIKPL